MSSIDLDKIDFLEEGDNIKQTQDIGYKVLIADDEESVHLITKQVLKSFSFLDKSIDFIDTYSEKETRKVLSEIDDIAIIFLDVVMEDNKSGLNVAKYIREELGNSIIRIILRTGEPGEAPEESVIRDYDINDYRLKTELTSRRLITTMYSALRSYRDLIKLENHKEGLKKIINATSSLFNKKSLDEFLKSILQELASFQEGNKGIVFMQNSSKLADGFISQQDEGKSKIISATGKYEIYNGKHLEAVPELSHLYQYLNSEPDTDETFVKEIDSGIIVQSNHNSIANNFIYIEGNPKGFDFNLINMFLTNFSIALDNFIMDNIVKNTQSEIVFALAETVESHFVETGNHVHRVSRMMYNYALKLHFSIQESEMIRLASTMHDVGKIAIPDTILQKPGKLTEEEFEIIKTHTIHGFKILSGSNLPVLKQAADIALNHHEKFDGTGYPGRKRGEKIPLVGKMMAIVDVYDALSHKRCYKDAIPLDEVKEYIINQKGKHFDPNLVDVFINNIDFICNEI